MSVRHAASRGRRVSALLLASALVVLAWCSVGGMQAAAATPTTPAVTATMSAPSGDEDTHAASVDQGPRAGAAHVVQVAPDAVPAPVVRLDAPRRLTTERVVDERGPPAEAEQATSGSRAPPA